VLQVAQGTAAAREEAAVAVSELQAGQAAALAEARHIAELWPEGWLPPSCIRKLRAPTATGETRGSSMLLCLLCLAVLLLCTCMSWMCH
jgi:Flp pilus assembly protein CpaB